MRLFPRTNAEQGAGANTFQGLLGTLSLALATYKPTPTLPTNSTAMSNVPLPPSSDAGGSSFQMAGGGDGNSSTPQIHLPHQNLNASEWGEASTLYVPNDWAGTSTGGNHLSTAVGPGGCPSAGDYKPNGSLPSATDFGSFNEGQAKVMRYRKQISVNLGSWFVLENWMAPSMFSCAKGERSAEHDFLLGYGHSQQGLKSAQARLEKHWDTWVTQDDFAKMASMGINTVRIPIGYWIMGEKQWLNHTPFHQYTSVYQNQLRYLARAIKWASEHDIGVLIDLHGAYGSQNGQAHSGMATGKIHFFDEPHERRTTELLVKLTEMYANVTNVIGIEALNEPNKNYQAKVYPWYHSAMNAMRKANNPQAKSLPIYFHDAFNLSAGASFVKERSDFVVQDTHLYFLYSKKDQRASPASHTADIRGTMSGLLNSQSRIARNNMIVGEWSCALAQNSLQKARDAHSSQSQFCNAQASVYRQHVGGWGFWSWRLESCKQNAGWCFQATEKTRLLTSPLHAWTQSSSSRTSSSPTFAGGKNKRAEAQQMDMDQVLSHIAQDVATMDKPDLPYSDPTSAPSPKSRRRGAGPAALAAWKVRSDATSAHQKASNAGYKDGYATVQQFVSHQSGHRTTSRISLSRMGFSGQFMADRFQAHVSQEALKQEDWAAYQDHFGQGLAAAEAKIAGIVEHHASSSSSASATASASSSSLSSS